MTLGHAILLTEVVGTGNSTEHDTGDNDSSPLFNITTTPPLPPPLIVDTTATQSNTTETITVTGYFMIGVCLSVIAFVLFLVCWHIVQRRYRRQSTLLASLHPRNDGCGNKYRIQRRYETVEHWIISKMVQPHDSFCERVLTNFGHHTNPPKPEQPLCCSPCSETEVPSSPTLNTTFDHDDDEDKQDRECPICMSSLQIGQIVSWSANERCRHVFHHECIKEWLLRHIDCCLCKEIFLPVDETAPSRVSTSSSSTSKQNTDALHDLSHRFASASATSYYCVESGLVRIPKSVRCTRLELEQLERRIFDGAVAPMDLVGLRGGRSEVSSGANGTNDGLYQPDLNVIEDHNNNDNAEGRSDTATEDPTSSNGNNKSQDDEEQSNDNDDNGEVKPCKSFDLDEDDKLICSNSSMGPDDDVEVGVALLTNNQLVSVSDILEGSLPPDNRCCIVEDTDGSVEVQETSSQRPV